MGGYGWRPYVPVSVRRARAMKELDKLRKKGIAIRPVEIEGRKIARTFWGEAWCHHLEKFSDFANRLPRGRTYVRNGSVCHLEIAEGSVKAMVSGSELYNVRIEIKRLPRKKWSDVRGRCAGQIGSLLELLQGRLSKSVMAVVTNREKGLFPLPPEISLECDCPDWAVMCKHVAAVLYGVGARLDEKPELLFRLRGVDHEELISSEADIVAAASAGERKGRKRIADNDLAEVFGIDLSEEGTRVAESPTRARKKPTPARRRSVQSRKKKRAGKPPGKRSAKKQGTTKNDKTRRKGSSPATKASRRSVSPALPKTRAVMGRAVARLRAKFNMSQSQFARLLGVSVSTISKWEKGKRSL